MIDIENFTLPERLPGKEAHLLLAPESRVGSLIREQTTPADARESAVLVLYRPENDTVLLIKRERYEGIHSNQLAFPGGKCDREDRNYIDTACREASEELGIVRNDVKIVGQLTELYVPPSNFTIYPILAFDIGVGSLTPSEREVAHYMRVPLKELNPKATKRFRVETLPNNWVYAPGFPVNGSILWGATAMILAELYQVFYP